MQSVGVDIGGTGIKAVLLGDRSRVIREVRAETPSTDPTGAITVARVAALVGAMEAPGVPLGVAAPGIVDEVRGIVVHSKNLGWRDLPLGALLADTLERQVVFGHDVRSGAIAEAAARPASLQPQAFLPIGTGISLAIVVGGEPIGDGWAGEIGLQHVEGPDGPVLLEDLASAAALARRIGVADGREVAERVRAGDPIATTAWQSAIHALAGALAWTAAVIGPHRVIIGGGLAEAGDLLLEPLDRALAVRLGERPRPRLERAQLGDLAAAVGAATVAWRRYAGTDAP
jgi:glucokinase